MQLNRSVTSNLHPEKRRFWVIAGSFLFAVLQSLCTAVMAISGLRLLIGFASLTAASLVPGFLFKIHVDRIRIPMLIVAVIGSVANLYVLWRIRSLRARPASQWRVQPVSAKQRRSEALQLALSAGTLVLVAVELASHLHLRGSM